MSANRSVQAAQRRRAGPPEPAAPGRGPQPSINSSQMFAAGQQQRMGPGSGQVSGRLAGQQAALSQKQMMDQQKAQMSNNGNSTEGTGSVSRMTIAQAITLITLRLGKVELQLNNSLNSGTTSMSNDEDEDHILVDKSLIHSLINRIDALEKRPASSGPVSSNQDIMLLKQQFETIKPIVIQSKNTLPALKLQVDTLKTELNETKELLTALQNLTMDNSNKIMAFNSVFNNDNTFLDDNLENEPEESQEEELELDTTHNDMLLESNVNINDIMGNNLKELIEQEFNDGL
jgi:hypothetical protein